MTTRAARAVAFDVDGTVLDTLSMAMAAAEDILALFGSPTTITTRTQMKQSFSRDALIGRFGSTGIDISLMHPVVMRTRCLAQPPSAIAGVVQMIVDVATAEGQRPTFYTAGYTDSAIHALDHCGLANSLVIGRDVGSKTEQLARWAEGVHEAFYVCDTATDVHRCHTAGVQAVAVSWGYDDIKDLVDAGATPVNTVAELRSTLFHHDRWGNNR